MDERDARLIELWRSVVGLALIDAVTGNSRSRLLREQARNWLRRPSASRAFVFCYAGLDLEAFTSRALPRLEREWAEIDARRTPPRPSPPASLEAPQAA